MYSLFLLCIVLIHHFFNDKTKFEQEIEKYIDKKSDIKFKILLIIYSFNLNDKFIFNFFYETFKSIDFLYDIESKPIISSELLKIKTDLNLPKGKVISKEFYEGFGNVVWI